MSHHASGCKSCNAPGNPIATAGVVRDTLVIVGDERMLGTILLIILILLLVGALPTWPYSGGWGYYPSGGLGLIVVILLVLVLLGRL